jgi:uncharacterized protein YrrD
MARLDTDLIGLPIVSMEDASVVAEVDGLVIDDSTLTVAGFLTNVGLYEASVLPFAATRAVGDDAVIVRSADVLVRLSSNPALAALAEKGIDISGARVVTLSGKEVGSVGGYFVDDRGRVVGLEFISEDLSSKPRDAAVVPVSTVHRVGPDLVVLKQDYAEHLLKDGSSLDRLAARPVQARPPVKAPAPAKPERAMQAEPPAAAPVPAKPPRGRATSKKPALALVETPPPPAEPPSGAETVSPSAEPPAPAASTAETAGAQHFLIGKRVVRRIEDVAGEVIAEEGDVVTSEMIQKARSSDQLLILSLNVE